MAAKSVSQQAERLLQETEKKAEKALTILWNDLPAWMRDNHYVHSGYRPQSNSFQASAASIGYLHNESVNIWTHLIGATMAGVAANTLYLFIKPRFELATSEDVTVFSCFFLGAIGCLGMSATYHTISNHSEAVAKFGNRLDYMGIVILIWGSFIPSIYYGFSAEPALIRLYWSMITTIGAGTLVVVMHPKFRSPAWRPFRAAMFVSMGLSAVIPVIHGFQKYGYYDLERQIGLSWLILQGFLYILGAAIYAFRVPERWKPGAFDIWGSSHQIFHVLVVLAATVHFIGLLKAFDYEHSFRSAALAGSCTFGAHLRASFLGNFCDRSCHSAFTSIVNFPCGHKHGTENNMMATAGLSVVCSIDGDTIACNDVPKVGTPLGALLGSQCYFPSKGVDNQGNIQENTLETSRQGHVSRLL